MIRSPPPGGPWTLWDKPRSVRKQYPKAQPKRRTIIRFLLFLLAFSASLLFITCKDKSTQHGQVSTYYDQMLFQRSGGGDLTFSAYLPPVSILLTYWWPEKIFETRQSIWSSRKGSPLRAYLILLHRPWIIESNLMEASSRTRFHRAHGLTFTLAPVPRR